MFEVLCERNVRCVCVGWGGGNLRGLGRNVLKTWGKSLNMFTPCSPPLCVCKGARGTGTGVGNFECGHNKYKVTAKETALFKNRLPLFPPHDCPPVLKIEKCGNYNPQKACGHAIFYPLNATNREWKTMVKSPPKA